jgi:hypothetical protein
LEKKMTEFYLVQRMTRNTHPFEKDRGIDRHFSLDYMGSSEFEWGAVPKALKRMRENKVEVSERQVDLHGKSHTVFFVSNPASADAKWASLQKWVDNGMRGKEWTKFDTMLETPDDRWPTDAWWSLEDDVAWALSRENAELLATAINNAPAKV